MDVLARFSGFPLSDPQPTSIANSRLQGNYGSLRFINRLAEVRGLYCALS